MANFNPKIIAFYLPQFHPFKENDEWWGKGFTEWTNVGKAKRLFHRHYQPRVPADLGYYDLRVPEVREQQAELAREAGVYGFCYWHYWFESGKQLMNRIFDEVISSGKPDFPICLGWANHSWYSKTWNKNGTDKLLIEQKYGGEQDYTNHFNYALKAFKDSRYIKQGNKPVFFIYDSESVPKEFITVWNKLAIQHGFDGICFIGRVKNENKYKEILEKGFSYVSVERMSNISTSKSLLSRRYRQLLHMLTGMPRNCYSYKSAYPYFINPSMDEDPQVIPTLIPCWDHSPRSNRGGLILHNSTPELFQKHIKQIFNIVKNKSEQNQFIFLKSWNEWAEGNYMEPDLKWGKQYIKVLKKEIEYFQLPK